MRRGAQIIEEALLIAVALAAIAIAIGALGQVQEKLNMIFEEIWNAFDWFFRSVFYFLPRD